MGGILSLPALLLHQEGSLGTNLCSGALHLWWLPEAKRLLSTSAFSSSVATSLSVLLIRLGTLSLTFLIWLTYL